MKKVFFAVLAVCAALVLSACGSPTQVNEAVAASTGEKIEGMTVKKAAGLYTLSEMNVIGQDKTDAITTASYDTNTVELKEDGSFVLTVKLVSADTAETTTGYFTVTDDGLVTLTKVSPADFDKLGKKEKEESKISLVSGKERILCNGKELRASGALATRVTMVYQKAVKE